MTIKFLKVAFLFAVTLFTLNAFGFSLLGVDHPRVVVVAPHPDDEILGSAGIIKAMETALQQDPMTDLHVIVMTCGDAYEEALEKAKSQGIGTFFDLGLTRHQESMNALRFLGANPGQLVYLGYPDGGMGKIFDSAAGVAYLSKFTNTTKVPYDFAKSPGAPYTRDSVIADLRGLFNEWKPNLVLTPTLTDQHHDHNATRKFVVEALGGLSFPVRHLEYLIHWEGTEADWPRATTTWDPPELHVPADMSFPISESGLTIETKKQAILFHATQIAVMGDYLKGFAKTTEQFWTPRAKLEDYAAPRSDLWTRLKRWWRDFRRE